MSDFHKGREDRYPLAGSNGRNGCRTGREQDDLIWRLSEQAGRCFPRGQTGGLFGELRISAMWSCSDLPISFYHKSGSAESRAPKIHSANHFAPNCDSTNSDWAARTRTSMFS
jgi:hypothetical protein